MFSPNAGTSRRWLAVPLLLLLAIPGAASAVTVNYQIDEQQSFLRVVEGVPAGLFEGFVVTVGSRIATTFAVIEREPGSLQTAVGGTITADRTGNRLTFSGGSVIDAQRNPLLGPTESFPPLGSETGSFAVEDNFAGLGAFETVNNDRLDFVLRDALADIVGGFVDLGTPGANMSFNLTAGIVDYEVEAFTASLFELDPPLGFQEVPSLISPVFNESLSPVTEAPDGTLTIPFELDFFYDIFGTNDSRLVIEGVVVAVPVLGTLAGDYNSDGFVNGADYAKWRNNRNAPAGTLNNDVDGGPIGAAQLATWKNNFGSGAASSITSVPEPAGLLGLLAGGALVLLSRRRRSI